MSILLVAKDERAALEAEFAKLKAAGRLPGGVELGTPKEGADGSATYVDNRWDAPEEGKTTAPVADRVAVMVADTKIAISTATKVVAEIPKTWIAKPIDIAPVDELPIDEKPPIEIDPKPIEELPGEVAPRDELPTDPKKLP